MVIHSIYRGLYDDCQMDADCWMIPCYTKCMDNRCAPMEPSCMNTTTTFMAPANFEVACPADPRDMVCTDIKDSWMEAGCHIFELILDEEIPTDSPPPTAELASQCLQYLTQYAGCATAAFNGSYLEHRMSPVHELTEIVTSFMTGGGGPKCVKVDAALAMALGALPCMHP